MAKVLIEGQELDIEDEIANDDASLVAALKTAWPEAAKATFTRKTKDGVLTVTVVKKAGNKGGGSSPIWGRSHDVNSRNPV